LRIGIVRGHVVLNAAVEELRGIRLLVVEPVTADNLAKNDGSGGGKALIVADHLGPGIGQMIAFSEGGEASNPYWPKQVPVDAYCALIVNTLDYHPPVGESVSSGNSKGNS
jgi:microcompartment protein CcmK/EutM